MSRYKPNQLPDPTSPTVTPPAVAGGAPSFAADHWDVRRTNMYFRQIALIIIVPLAAKGADAPFRIGHMYHDGLHEVAMRELDFVPFALSFSRIEYPAALMSTGYVGDLWMTAAVRSDGTVQWTAAFRGDNRAFALLAENAVRLWRFTPPQKDGKAVAAFLNFRLAISEAAPVTISLGEPPPNHLPDPTSTSVTPPAGAGGAPSGAEDH